MEVFVSISPDRVQNIVTCLIFLPPRCPLRFLTLSRVVDFILRLAAKKSDCVCSTSNKVKMNYASEGTAFESKNLDFSIFTLQYDLRRNTFKEIAMD